MKWLWSVLVNSPTPTNFIQKVLSYLYQSEMASFTMPSALFLKQVHRSCSILCFAVNLDRFIKSITLLTWTRVTQWQQNEKKHLYHSEQPAFVVALLTVFSLVTLGFFLLFFSFPGSVTPHRCATKTNLNVDKAKSANLCTSNMHGRTHS